MKRWLIGIVGVVFLILGISFYASAQQNYAGIFIRVGMLLSTIWLAWPQFDSLKNRASFKFLVAVLGFLLLIAIKPKWAIFAGPILVAGFFLNAFLRRFSKR